MTEPKANPMAVAQRLARPEVPRRFYKTATVGEGERGFVLLLDGRPAKTPGRRRLTVADRTVADALAAEWAVQRERLDPLAMPLTRIVNAAIDRVAAEMAAVRAEIVAYAHSDLVCYRAEGPEGLIAAQEVAWSPLIDWARDTLGARLALAEGVMPITQNAEVGEAVERAIVSLDALSLAALSTATTLTGSAFIALALARAHLSPDEAWAAAHVDEDWQMSQWGADDVALARRATRRRELDAAAVILGG